jgi:hypothetical protein
LIWEVVAYVVLGTAVGLGAPRVRPRRFADRRRMTVVTGAVAGVIGGAIAHSAVSENLAVTLLAALGAAVLMVGVAARPAPGSTLRVSDQGWPFGGRAPR